MPSYLEQTVNSWFTSNFWESRSGFLRISLTLNLMGRKLEMGYSILNKMPIFNMRFLLVLPLPYLLRSFVSSSMTSSVTASLSARYLRKIKQSMKW